MQEVWHELFRQSVALVPTKARAISTSYPEIAWVILACFSLNSDFRVTDSVSYFEALDTP